MIWGEVEMGNCKNGSIKFGEEYSWGNVKMGQEIVEKMIIWGDA